MGELAVAVFVASLAGSLHCVGMCGPFVALTTLGRRKTRRPLAPAVAYNLGRGVAYAVVGALAGGIGMAIDAGGMLAGMQRAATMLAGVTMIVIGAVWLLDLLAGARSLGGPRDRVAEAITRRLRALFASSQSLGPLPRAAALGMLTSLMPCGWLYAFAITAAGTGSPLRGALLMLVFWAGNVPILLLLGAGVVRLSPFFRRRLPTIMAVLVLAVGVFTVAGRATIPLPHADPPPDDAPSTAVPQVPPCHAS